MCGFYSRAELNTNEFKKFYSVEKIAASLLKPHFTIRPKSTNVVVTRNSPNKAEEMVWFFHPGWSGLPLSRGVINVRIESLVEGKTYFNDAFLHRRCLIPASSWIEWVELQGVKIPYVFTLKSRQFFAFAGLWNEYTDTFGKTVKGYAIITTTPNKIAKTIHNRQPAVLRENDYNCWLDPQETDRKKLIDCLDVYPAEDMHIFPVARDLSDDKPEILLPIDKEQLQEEVLSAKNKYRQKSKLSPGQERLV